MTSHDQELLSALLDREPVDPDTLARVLDTPEGRGLLVDFVRIRHVLHAAPPEVGTAVPRHDRRRAGWSRVAARAAAGLLLVIAGGFGGAWLTARGGDAEQAPEPSRVVQLTPVDVPWPGAER